MRKQGSWLDKETVQGTMPGARRRGRPRTHGLDEQHQDVDGTLRGRVRMTEGRDKWRKDVNGVDNRPIEGG